MDIPAPPVIDDNEIPINIRASKDEHDAAVRARQVEVAEQNQLERQYERETDCTRHPQLDNAIQAGNEQLVLAELEKVREENADARTTFNTALQRAIECDRPEIAVLLLRNGVSPSSENLLNAAARGLIPLVEHIWKDLSWPINKLAEEYLHTVLTVSRGDKGMIEWLLQKDADVNMEDSYAETLLSRAVERGSFEIIDVLLEAGADVSKGAILPLALQNDLPMSYELVKRFLGRGAPTD